MGEGLLVEGLTDKTGDIFRPFEDENLNKLYLVEIRVEGGQGVTIDAGGAFVEVSSGSTWVGEVTLGRSSSIGFQTMNQSVAHYKVWDITPGT